MKTQEILNGNKLIAEFMGIEKKIYSDTPSLTHYNYNNTMNQIKDMKYHSSWDWLMPICKKIASIDNIYSAGIAETLRKYNFEIIPVWKAVVQHIELSNKRSKI